MEFANFNEKIQVLTVSAPPKALEPNKSYKAKIADEKINFKKVNKKKDNTEMQIAEVLIVVEGFKPFKAALLSESPEEFKSKKMNDEVSVFIKFDGKYTNAEI